jgi:hypothetical protein
MILHLRRSRNKSRPDGYTARVPEEIAGRNCGLSAIRHRDANIKSKRYQWPPGSNLPASPGFPDDSFHHLHPFRKQRPVCVFASGGRRETVSDGVQGRPRASQHGQKIFLRDGPVRRMDVIPPAADRLLYLRCCLLTDYQGCRSVDALWSVGLSRLQERSGESGAE